MLKKILSAALCASFCIGVVGCGASEGAKESDGSGQPENAQKSDTFEQSDGTQELAADEGSDGWSCIFAAAMQPSQTDMLPQNPQLSNSTCRQEFQASMGSSKIRLTFSNEHSDTLNPPDSDLVMESVHIAKLLKPGEPNIDTATDTVVTFGGSESVTIPSGETVTSDEIDFAYSALDFLAVSVKFGSVPACPSAHLEADCGSWVVEGDHVSENFNPAEWMWSYFSLCRADGYSEGSETLVCFGDSITDGSISTWNGFDAWPDILAQSLQSDSATSHISVVNTGIGGNAIWGGSGIPAKDRFERDALDIPGVKYVIILIGTNDIPGAQTDISENMIAEYKAMAKACHERGIKIYGGTITPFGTNEWWASELHEEIRKKVNQWIMSPDSGFDGYVDFASAVCDPSDDTKFKKENDSGDGLHPSSKGHKVMGEEASRAIKEFLK